MCYCKLSKNGQNVVLVIYYGLGDLANMNDIKDFVYINTYDYDWYTWRVNFNVIYNRLGILIEINRIVPHADQD